MHFPEYITYMTSKSDQNKQNAIAFYKMAYEGYPHEAAKLYVGSKHI